MVKSGTTVSALGLQAALLLGSVAIASRPEAAVLLFAAGGGGGGDGSIDSVVAHGLDGLAGENGSSGQGTGGGAGGLIGGGGVGGADPNGRGGGGGEGWTGGGGAALGAGAATGGSGLPSFSGGIGELTTQNKGGDGGIGGGGGGGGIFGGGGGGGGYSGGGGGVIASGDISGGGGGGGSYVDPSVTSPTLVSGSNGYQNGGHLPGDDGYVYIGVVAFPVGVTVDYLVPTTGDYFVSLAGAQGGSGFITSDYGGYGAAVSGYVELLAGTELEIVVGAAGMTGSELISTPQDISFEGAGGGGGSFVFETSAPPPTPVPELSTWAMMLLGFAGLGFVRYRTSRKGAALTA